MTDTTLAFADWVGRRETVTDTISVEQYARACATFDLHVTGELAQQQLPPLWHWFFFLPTAAQAALDVDGHPQRGGFLPPIPLPRRMFAGSRMRFHRLLQLGRSAERTSEIRDVVLKSGRSGSLAFVTVQSQIRQDGALCIEEEQDIVYREQGAPVSAPVVREPEPSPAEAWSQSITPDSRLLFRFSSLTFNAHRIHYDREYAVRDEGYPGLVVHGPLTAVLLANLVRAHTSARIATFAFRGVAPLFDLAPFQLRAQRVGDDVTLEARGPDNALALSAEATLG
jgi:3-methylfumaryl-CoA hydratase